jgi:alpha 1,2-mannosyltransferase
MDQQCGPTIDHNLNTHMIQYSHQLWASQTRQSIHEHRTELIDYMEDVLARNLTQNYGHGRGIVMTAGNADTLKRVKWTLMMLRGYGCGLPVQIVSLLKSI